jgi:tetratricopeptide (TPR) repeat protein
LERLALSNKHKHGRPGGGGTSTADLKARIERTCREGKFQQALELVKQLHKAEPTPAHLELLKNIYFQRAAQLRTQGYSRDAATVLEVAARLDEKNPAWIQKLAAEMARCGEVARAQALTARLSGEALDGALLAQIVDGALLQGKGGRAALPAPLQGEFDRVVEAFNLVEAGHDDKAREALAAIGLRSPFLEWKLLLRGLQAYHQNDDDRARENWQRLDTQRLPARLAAPFRAAIDPDYQRAQSQATQTLLRQQFEQVQSSSLDRLLRDLRSAAGKPDRSVALYRSVENLLPVLRQEAPQAVARLGRVLYWSIPRNGPDSIPRHRRLFGSPPDDRNYHRIEATAYEEADELEEAHAHWRRYEAEIAAHTDWPEEERRLARALVWLRMASNAATVPTREMLRKMPRLLRGLSGIPEPLKPSAEECFRQCLELAPKLLDAHTARFHYFLRNEQFDQAAQAGEKLVEQFPDHVDTLEELADLHSHKDKPARAIELLEQALGHHGLSRDLRRKMLTAQMSRARQLAEKGKYDQARVHYQAGLDYAEGNNVYTVCGRWAAAEMKAGDTARAEELLAQARSRSPGELVLTYILLVEANRLKLGGPIKTRYTREFNKEVAGTGTPELAIALVGYVASLDAQGVDYHGWKSHTKKIFEYADRIDRRAFSEAQLQELLWHMVHLEPPARLLDRFLQHAQVAYPNNPFFPYFEAVHEMGDEPEEAGSSWRITPLFDEAESKARPLPSTPELKAMLDDIKRRRALLALLNPFLNLPGFPGFPGFPGGGMPDFFDFFGEDEDDDDDDEGW